MLASRLDTLTALFAIGQMLHQYAARDAAAADMVDGDADKCRDLFGLVEILHGRFGKIGAFQRHDALIATAALRFSGNGRSNVTAR